MNISFEPTGTLLLIFFFLAVDWLKKLGQVSSGISHILGLAGCICMVVLTYSSSPCISCKLVVRSTGLMRSGPLLLFLMQEYFVVDGVHFLLHLIGQPTMTGDSCLNFTLTVCMWWKWSFCFMIFYGLDLFDIYIISKYYVSKTKFKRPLLLYILF